MGRICKDEKGFGLAETMVAAVILLLVALAAATVFYQGAVSTVNTKHTTEAVHRAHERLEILRARGRAWIENNLSPPRTIIESCETIGDDFPATATTTIVYVDDVADSLGIDPPPYTDPAPNDYLVVVVEIDWQENNQARVRRIGTIIQ